MLPLDIPLKAEWAAELLNGVMIIQGEALVIKTESFKSSLYQSVTDMSFKTRKVRFKAIPCYAWANRELGPMIVWIRSTGGVFVKNCIKRQPLYVP